MTNPRHFHHRPGVGKTNYSANLPTQLTWDFETGLVKEEDPNDEAQETTDNSTEKETA